ncbi:hypothetical protein LTR70_002231 [Exophiala xenobiotica]|uniref:Uncharacterized protein n=1 Tax=Lithohypha guttulata TaxID=1690604 RepID=A0ABR0KLD1_9EURO|nr:hypothetical protein LTR24_001347 [Lithohypha guttulata]KAK5325966.1 hypothetical protein LTR70_002231 [Exophiala xenobiotica]
MDHTTQQHLSELDRAEELAYAGHEEEALAICFKLRLQASLAVYLRASVNLLMAILIEEPIREKHARECIDLLDILVQKHEHEANIEKQLEHVEELNEFARDIIQRCERRRQVEPKTPDTPTVEIGKRLGDMHIDEKVGNVFAVFKSENWGRWDLLPTNQPRIEGFLRDKYLYRPLGSAAATPIAPPAQGSEVGKLAVLDIRPRDTPTPVSSTQTKPSSPPQLFTSSSQRASSYPPTSVMSPAEMK